jgi:hypothetical protein
MIAKVKPARSASTVVSTSFAGGFSSDERAIPRVGPELMGLSPGSVDWSGDRR